MTQNGMVTEALSIEELENYIIDAMGEMGSTRSFRRYCERWEKPYLLKAMAHERWVRTCL